MSLHLPVAAQSAREAALRAAFVYHMARYATWPESAFASPESPLTFCTLGTGPELTALEDQLDGRRISGRDLLLNETHSLQDLAGCHVVFAATGVDSAQVDAALTSLGDRGVLTLAELDRFNERGGIVRFWLESADGPDGDRMGIRFAINLDVAERVNLRLSSKVLKLARISRGGK